MIKKLYVEPTSLCNLRCSMCFRNNWFEEKNEFMAKETQAALFSDFKHLKPCTIFFGGMLEPLLHPDIIEMIGAAKAVCIPLSWNI